MIKVPDIKSHRKPLVLLLGALVTSRLLFIYVMPPTFSKDMYAWVEVIAILKRGGNPYREASLLNYPPFWLQVLYGISKIADATGFAATRLVQSVLIFGEAIVIILTYALSQFLSLDKRKIFWVLMLALVLNPITILLNCQHGNFDVFVGFWILLFTICLLRFYQSKSSIHWLMACLALGLGILTKTIPVILIPLLFIGIQGQRKSISLFGAILLFLPISLGISIIYVLAPEGVAAHVLGYRSMAGWYGISGILNLLGQYTWIDMYSAFSPFLILSLMLWVAYKAWRIKTITAPQLLTLLLILLVFLPTFGPGYSPPYILWFLPLMLLYFSWSKRSGILGMILGFVILSLTYIVEYAYFPSHGAFIQAFDDAEGLAHYCASLGESKSQSIIRLPMFVFYLWFYFGLLKDKNNVLMPN